MKATVLFLLGVCAWAVAAQAAAQVTFYDRHAFEGQSFTTGQRERDLRRRQFNDRASSVIVAGERWQVCEDARFEGRCVVLRPGRYPSLAAIGLDEQLSSIRPLASDEHVVESDYAPMPVEARRRSKERLYDAPVTAVQAVPGAPAQRCWMEREQPEQQQPAGYNLPGAAVGALIGGILGNQVGGGSGKKIATVGGAVGGAALGAQYGRNDALAAPQAAQETRRCDSNPVQATAAYWDVTYDFRGQQRSVRMSTEPGRTVIVNGKGEPRP